jgi:hypothetical protein
MIMRFVGCWSGRLRVREAGVLGEYCVGDRKGEEKGGARLIGSRVVVLQGGSLLKNCI